ncbi:MAG TPA: hypothetical protein V6D17_14630 [Candidatus Obscuribacterales bacterium]
MSIAYGRGHHFIAAALIITVSAAPALSQGAQGSQFRPRAPLKEKHFDSDYKVTALAQPVDCPDLPRFTGKQRMVSGIYTPRKEGGTSYVINYATSEDVNTVRNWYRQAFTSNQWQITRDQDNYIKAHHPNGHYCTASFNPLRTGPEKCKYTLNFFQKSK